MGDDLKARLKRLMEEREFSAASLSRAAGLNLRAVSDILEGKSQPPRMSTVRALAATLGVSVSELVAGDAAMYQRVLVIGRVEEEGTWVPESKTVDEIELRLDDGEPVGIEIATKAYMPVYRPGDRLLGVKYPGRAADALVGMDCFGETTDGRRFLGFLERGNLPHRYHVRPYFPTESTIENVKVRWVAPIDLIRRARR